MACQNQDFVSPGWHIAIASVAGMQLTVGFGLLE